MKRLTVRRKLMSMTIVLASALAVYGNSAAWRGAASTSCWWENHVSHESEVAWGTNANWESHWRASASPSVNSDWAAHVTTARAAAMSHAHWHSHPGLAELGQVGQWLRDGGQIG